MAIRPADPALLQVSVPVQRWVGKAKLFNEDINVIKEPVLGTASGSPVILSSILADGYCAFWDCQGEEGTTYGTPVKATVLAPARPPPNSVLGDPAPHLAEETTGSI